MKAAIVLVAFVLCYVFILSRALDEDDKEEFRCVKGNRYRENDCNNCRCFQGRLACTRRACKSYSDPKYMNCRVGTTWTKDCKKCWCTKDHHTVCAIEKKCPSS